MQAVDTALLSDLKARGLVSQMTAEDALAEHMNSGPVSLYCGFDPTADSLHIGSLVPLLTLARFQQAGHTPIALVGGATGLIGDPSFKAAERKLNTSDTVAQWVDRLKVQLAQFVEFDTEDNAAQIVNNLDWTQDVSVLDFLRDIGKHFSVNNMINKESVKQRLDREGSGISFTEFTYMLLQSFDFAELYRRNRCTMQIGGSDQWGNITGGIDLTRRLHNAQVFGLTLPLVTKADGTKFGKTESGTIWLSPEKTSAYAFYQFWLNTADADVYKFLKYFTFLSVDAIDEIEANDKSSGQKPEAQSILAAEVTKLVHGDSGFVAAKRITDALFRGETVNLNESDLEQLKLDGMPFSFLPASTLAASPLTQILSESGMAKSGRLVKDALGRSAVFANGTALSAEDNMRALDVFAKNQAMFGRFFIVKLGKKKNHLFELTA